MKNLILTLVAFAMLVVVGSAGYAWWAFAMRPASPVAGELLVDVPPGSTLTSVVGRLREVGLNLDPFMVRVWARLSGVGRGLRVGEYAVQGNWPARNILETILKGPPRAHRLTIKEGQNIWDIEKSFASSIFGITPQAWWDIVSDSQLLARMEVPAPVTGVKRSLEGYLFPETYTFYKYDSPRTVVDAMLAEFRRKALPILKQHPWGQTPEGRYKLITLASIVEKESGDISEQPIIASVYWNRINKKMRLQADPTTIYGLMPGFDGNLRKIDLLTTTPYNTYKIAGLPAGPIANPGLTALQAVVKPAQTKYLFFVSRNDGTHIFSEDYKTHDRAVNEFQRLRRGAGAGKNGQQNKNGAAKSR